MSKKSTAERFAELFQKIEQSPSYRIEGLKVELSEQIYLAMQKGGVNNAELARLLGKSRPYVTKVLSGNVNFTLETLVTVAEALGYELKFELTPKPSAKRWESIAAQQPTARRVDWRAQNYIRLVNPKPTTEEATDDSLPTAA